MDEKKDSGVDWLGKIPAHWNLTKISMVYDERRTKVSDKNFMPLSVTKNGIVPQLESAAKTDNGDNRKLILKGDFVINSRSDRRGSCGISQYDGSCSLINTVLISRQEMCNGFYSFVFKTEPFADEFYKWGHGIVDDLWSTKWSDMKHIKIPLPPLEEQKKIAAYLDRKCSAIDSAVDAAKKMVETLSGYKKSLITEIVTKGLNPAAKMIAGGVGWIGKIPAHWKISKLKYVCKIFGRIGFRGYTQSDLVDKGEGAITLSPSNITDEGMSYKKCSFLSWKKYEESPEIKIYDGDILMVKTGSSYGKSCLVTNLPLKSTINPQLLVIKEILSDNKFLSYVMKTTMIKTQIEVSVVGGAIPTISQEKIRNFQFPLPPIDEQKKIADYLDRKCSAIDENISVHKNLSEKLSEYKKSLIYEVVTGKISV